MSVTNQSGTDRGGRSRVLLLLAAMLIYGVISFAYFGSFGSWTNRYLGTGLDPVSFMWFLNWWPFALGHHLNPFISNYVWFPHGVNFTWLTSMPLAALITAPITILFGPTLSFNLLTILAPTLAAWSAFVLAWYLSRDWAASLVGGYFFGFSSYELAQMLGHLNLDSIWLVPTAVLLCSARVRGDLGRRAFVISLAAVLVCQLGLSTEILASLCVLGALTWVIFLAHASPADRPALWQLTIDIALSGILVVVVAAPFLFYIFKGLNELPAEINSASIYSADPLNYFIPTSVTRLGRSVFSSIAAGFTGNASEQGAYLGLPLIFLMAQYFRDQLGRRYARALLVTTCVLVVLSLGPWLHIGPVQTRLPLPWRLTAHVPVIRDILPSRFPMYVTLCAAVASALWLAAAEVGRWRAGRYVIAALAALFLVPSRASSVSWSSFPTQPFFAAQHLRDALAPMTNVIILPYEYYAPSMAWQLEANMQFTQSGGYVGIVPVHESAWPVLSTFMSSTYAIAPHFANDLAAFCATHRVDYILISAGTPAPLAAAIAALGWPQHMDDGIDVVRVPPPSALNYVYITGDYWGSDYEHLDWIGQRATIATNRTPAALELVGIGREVSSPTEVTLSSQSGKTVYQVNRSTDITINLPANSLIQVTASNAFVPNLITHSGDARSLSVRVSLRPLAH